MGVPAVHVGRSGVRHRQWHVDLAAATRGGGRCALLKGWRWISGVLFLAGVGLVLIGGTVLASTSGGPVQTTGGGTPGQFLGLILIAIGLMVMGVVLVAGRNRKEA